MKKLLLLPFLVASLYAQPGGGEISGGIGGGFPASDAEVTTGTNKYKFISPDTLTRFHAWSQTSGVLPSFVYSTLTSSNLASNVAVQDSNVVFQSQINNKQATLSSLGVSNATYKPILIGSGLRSIGIGSNMTVQITPTNITFNTIAMSNSAYADSSGYAATAGVAATAYALRDTDNGTNYLARGVDGIWSGDRIGLASWLDISPNMTGSNFTTLSATSVSVTGTITATTISGGNLLSTNSDMTLTGVLNLTNPTNVYYGDGSNLTGVSSTRGITNAQPNVNLPLATGLSNSQYVTRAELDATNAAIFAWIYANLTNGGSGLSALITANPTSVTTNSGSNILFSVTASGTAPLHYQWRVNSNDIAGATSATFSTNYTSATNWFGCQVTNGYGVVTSTYAFGAWTNTGAVACNTLGDSNTAIVSQNWGVGEVSNYKYLAYQFTSTVSRTYCSVKLYVAAVGSGNTIDAAIFSDSSNQPNVIVAGGAWSAAVSITNTNSYEQTFSSMTGAVTAGTNYWIVVRAATAAGVNYVSMPGISFGGGYPVSTSGSGDASSWTSRSAFGTPYKLYY